MSPLLLENSNSRKETPQAIQSSIKSQEIDLPEITFFTPRKSTEIKAQLARFEKLDESGPSTQRLLFRKIIKGFEDQESVLASNSYQIQSLEV